jgi:GDP-L-fucose synthase
VTDAFDSKATAMADMSAGRELFQLAGKRVWVAGHGGMVGGALLRRLEREDCQVVTVDRDALDLRRQKDTEDWLAQARADVVVVAAATVGGILANDSRPAEFLYDNLMIESNVIEAARRSGVAKLLFLAASCSYPRLAEQPMSEAALLEGPLEPTNQWYALAKISGIKLCQAYRRQYGLAFISAIPTNLYGPGDSFDPDSAHVVAALLRKVHEAVEAGAETVEVWGSGTPRREFLYVDDCADALVFLLRHYSGEDHVNVGTGREVTIRELAALIAETVGYRGRFAFDTSRPDGAPRKLLDVGRLTALGWRAETELAEGLARTFAWYRARLADAA